MPSKKLSIKKKIYRHSQSESQIQTKLINNLKRLNPTAFIVKISDKWNSGLPDVLMIKDGKAYFYEVKSSKGKVSKIQEVVHQKLVNAGGVVEIWRGGVNYQ